MEVVGPMRYGRAKNTGSSNLPKNSVAVQDEDSEDEDGEDEPPSIVITSADAIKIVSNPLYIDRRGEEDLTCAGLIILAMLCLLMFFTSLIGGLL
jgi:hypothetical protein